MPVRIERALLKIQVYFIYSLKVILYNISLSKCCYVFPLGLSDTTVLAIYRDILKISISRYFVINYRDTMPVHYCHLLCSTWLRILVSDKVHPPGFPCREV